MAGGSRDVEKSLNEPATSKTRCDLSEDEIFFGQRGWWGLTGVETAVLDNERFSLHQINRHGVIGNILMHQMRLLHKDRAAI